MCFDDPRPEMGDGNREWAAEKGNITIMAQNDIGIDLGTTTIIIAQEGQGVVTLFAPVRVEKQRAQLAAAGVIVTEKQRRQCVIDIQLF